MTISLPEAARLRLPDMIRVRRQMHRHPEVGLVLPKTRELILQELDGLDLEVVTHETTSGVVAVLRSGRPDGPVTLLRADNDALPLVEATGLPFASETGSSMHACGHDLHTAMLLAAAGILCERSDDLPGPVVFMFQPGEEGLHGAPAMLGEGVLDAAGRRPSRAFAIHVFGHIAAGSIGLRSGPVMAASDQFHIRVTGAGGHASTPHLAVDPIPAAAEMVLALQSALTRRVSAHDPTVITVGHIAGGSAPNIIPEQVELHGTIRTLSDDTRASVHELVGQVVDGVSMAHGVASEARIAAGYPVTVNDGSEKDRVAAVASRLFGDTAVFELAAPLMVAEDWSYVLREVPGVMAVLGARPSDVEESSAPVNHSDRVVFDEDAMAVGAALYAGVALEG